MNNVFTVLLFGLVGLQAYTQNTKTVIIKQTTHAYTLTAPEGWNYDEDNARSMMIDMAFHPDTTKWTKAPIVMYSNITHKSTPEQTLDEVVQLDATKFLENSPGAVSKETESWLTYPQKKRAKVVEFRNPNLNNYESVAFIEEQYYVIMIVIGSRNEAIYEQNLTAFRSLVQSYFNLAN